MTRSDDKPRVYGAVVYPLVFAENCETRDDSVPGIRAMNFARVRPEIASGRSERKTHDKETIQKESFYQRLFIGTTNCAIFWEAKLCGGAAHARKWLATKRRVPLMDYSVRQHFWNSNHTQPREIIVSHSRHSFTAKLAYLTSTFLRNRRHTLHSSILQNTR